MYAGIEAANPVISLGFAFAKIAWIRYGVQATRYPVVMDTVTVVILRSLAGVS